eukprot:2962947-Rhodomonas_salina.1
MNLQNRIVMARDHIRRMQGVRAVKNADNILEIRGPNTVCIEVPPWLSRIEPIQNVLNLKPYHELPPDIGPTSVQAPPDLIDGEDEFEIRVLWTRGRPVVAREKLNSCSGYP